MKKSASALGVCVCVFDEKVDESSFSLSFLFALGVSLSEETLV